jgi:hypothetical protein
MNRMKWCRTGGCVLCSVAKGVMMVAKLVSHVLFLYAFVVNRHSLDFVVGCRKQV